MDEDILKFDNLIAYLSVIGSIILIGGLVFWSVKLLNIQYERSYDRPAFHQVVWFVSCIVVPLLFIGTCVNIHNIIKIKMIPKQYMNDNYKTVKVNENKEEK
jgi:hypothetical protein